MRNLIAPNWGLGNAAWVVVNGIPGEMNFDRLVATGFRDEREAHEFIRMATGQTKGKEKMKPIPESVRKIHSSATIGQMPGSSALVAAILAPWDFVKTKKTKVLVGQMARDVLKIRDAAYQSKRRPY